MRFKVWQERWTTLLSHRKFLSSPPLIKCTVLKIVICKICPCQRDMIFRTYILESYMLASAWRLLLLLKGIEGLFTKYLGL